MRIALWLHILGTVVWVGGMFFAHVALRPAAAQLPPPQRLTLMAATLATFFTWAGGAIVAILASGFTMIFATGGFTGFGAHVHLMTAMGLVMSVIYAAIVALPFPRLRAAVAAGEWERAGAALAQVRRLVSINLVLGLATLTVAILGHDVV